ncbi:MAG: O-antigen ligase family protein [Gallionellaceae bacterium]
MLNFRSALTLSSWPMIVFFTVALIPFSIKLGDQGISANYLFFLFPILVLLSGKSLILPQRLYLEFIAIYIAILCLATAYQYTLLGEFDRRLVSFTIFMGMFVFMFVKITPKMLVGFKISVILISLYFSIYSIYGYILEGAEVLGFSAKDVVGTQRIGFVYIVAFWILLLFRTQSIMMRALKISAISCIFFGLLLTFSRASIVALVGSLIVYNVMHSYERLRNHEFILSRSQLSIFVTIFLIIALLLIFFPVPFDFFAERLFSNTTAAGDEVYDFENPNASEGYRVWMLQKVLDFVMYNPFTGSGYLGVWVAIDEGGQGATHNQYTDVLFRTGVIGFGIYLYILYTLGKYLYKNHLGLFYGFVGVLIYGMFHETFKESQGAFMLAFMVGMMSSAQLSARRRLLK